MLQSCYIYFIMDSLFSQKVQIGRSRSRCYSSMNYQEYEEFFGTPPKMPEAPSSKPLEDPQDIPQLTLEDESAGVRQPLKIKQVRKIAYKIDTIPQIEGSQDNSIAFNSPRKNFQFLFTKTSSKLEDGGDELETIMAGARKRNRPRSYSQNSPLTSKLKIIDFLRQTQNKYILAQQRGRKMVKTQ